MLHVVDVVVLYTVDVYVLHIADVGSLILDEEEKFECQGQETAAQEVTQGCQVWDGGVVGVNWALPHVVDQPVGSVQQDPERTLVILRGSAFWETAEFFFLLFFADRSKTILSKTIFWFPIKQSQDCKTLTFLQVFASMYLFLRYVFVQH